MGKLSNSSVAVDGSNETKTLAQSVRRSSTNIKQRTCSYRRASFCTGSLMTKSSSVDRALVAAAKRNSLKKRPTSLRNSIFVSSTAWQPPKNSDDTPPLQPKRPPFEIDKVLRGDSEEDAPPSMPQRQASTSHLTFMNANMPTRKDSVQDYANITNLNTNQTLVMPMRKASCDTMFSQTCNDFCSVLANQRNAKFGEAPAKPLRLSSIWDMLRETTPIKPGAAALKQDKAPLSCKRKASVSEISNFANINLRSRNNLQSMASPPDSVLIPQSSPEPSSSNTPSIYDIEETWAWVQRDFYALVACQHCHTELTCIRNVAHVQCRQCHKLTPNPNHTGDDETTGAGLTLQDLRRLEEQGTLLAKPQSVYQRPSTTGYNDGL